MKIFITLIILCMMALAGCEEKNVVQTHPPTALEILQDHPSADIFQWDGRAYQTGIAWVDELELTKKEYIGKISKHYVNGKPFSDGMATQLPVGAEIYSSNEREDIYIVEVKGDIKKYLVSTEG
ncbi:MAG: hypothetical protein ACO1OC_11325 [Tuberibacillus sp.]